VVLHDLPHIYDQLLTFEEELFFLFLLTRRTRSSFFKESISDLSTCPTASLDAGPARLTKSGSSLDERHSEGRRKMACAAGDFAIERNEMLVISWDFMGISLGNMEKYNGDDIYINK
jgi:hypothetical protein